MFSWWNPPPMTPLKSPHKTRIQRLRGIAVHLEGIAGHGAGDGFGARPLQRHHGAAAQLEGARGALLRDTPNEKAIFPWENVGYMGKTMKKTMGNMVYKPILETNQWYVPFFPYIFWGKIWEKPMKTIAYKSETWENHLRKSGTSVFFNGHWRNIGSSTWDLTEYDGDRKNHAWKIAKETWMFSKIFIGDMGWDIYIYITNSSPATVEELILYTGNHPLNRWFYGTQTARMRGGTVYNQQFYGDSLGKSLESYGFIWNIMGIYLTNKTKIIPFYPLSPLSYTQALTLTGSNWGTELPQWVLCVK